MIEKLSCINNDKLQSSGIIFKVKRGDGKLRVQSIINENGHKKKCLFLGNIPLVIYSVDLNEKSQTVLTMQLAEGREYIDEDIVDKFDCVNGIKNILEDFSSLSEILNLLEDGYYVLSQSYMIPTLGDSRCFNLVDGRKVYIDLEDFNEGKESNLYKFLISSRGIHSYDMCIVDEYIKKIKNGNELTILGYSLPGSEPNTVVLDGHHKAMAGFLENKMLKCINIIPCSINEGFIVYENNYINLGLIDGYENYKNESESQNVVDLKMIRELIEKTLEIELEKDKEKIIFSGDVLNNLEIRCNYKFPTSKDFKLAIDGDHFYNVDINLLSKIKGIDINKHVKSLFSYYKLYKSFDKVLKLGKEILSHDSVNLLWEDVALFLSDFKEDEVKQIFEEFEKNQSSTKIGKKVYNNIISKYLIK